jgi:signal transduction histidine kinase
LIEASRRFSTADWIVAGTALFIIGNGASICVGWWARIPILVQLPTDAPTHFNTALVFVLLGVGELGLVFRRRRVVMAMAVLVTWIASAELAEYALHLNMGIDTLFAVPFVGLDSPHPGRMSGNTIACFLLVCAAQVIMSKPDREAGSATTAAVILKSLAGGIAFIAMLGYLAGLPSAYGWSDSVGMSMRSCAGFLLIFIARIAALWQRDIMDKPSLPDWLLPFLTIAVGSISIGLFWILTSPLVRPYMLDPVYARFAHRSSLATAVGVGTLIFLGTISVLVARHKAVIARVSQQKLSSVLEQMSEGVMLIDAKGEAFYENPAYVRIHGFEPHGMRIMRYKDLPIGWQGWDEQGRPLNLDGWPLSRVTRGERVQNQEVRARRWETNLEFFGNYNGSPIYDDDGNIALSFITIQDITDRKLSELSLRDKNQQLERSNRDLEDFAYIASHDLKTPLSGIRSTALWLEQDLQDLSDESRKLLVLMRSRINRMEKLLDDLLTFSRVGRTDVAREAPLTVIFASIIEVLNPPAHIQVRVEGELLVVVTAAAELEQVLRNLIDNAIKHHDKPHGEVVLSATRVGDFVEIIVHDDGPGILPQFHEKIFELFQTLKRRDDGESTGMGLTIVKKLIERLNCRILVHSEGNGTGTEFRFQWPTSSTTTYDKEPTNA